MTAFLSLFAEYRNLVMSFTKSEVIRQQQAVEIESLREQVDSLRSDLRSEKEERIKDIQKFTDHQTRLATGRSIFGKVEPAFHGEHVPIPARPFARDLVRKGNQQFFAELMKSPVETQ